jgi:hypothetical protein
MVLHAAADRMEQFATIAPVMPTSPMPLPSTVVLNPDACKKRRVWVERHRSARALRQLELARVGGLG